MFIPSAYVGSKFCKCIINENGRVKISIDYEYFIKKIYVMALIISSRVKRRLLLIISIWNGTVNHKVHCWWSLPYIRILLVVQIIFEFTAIKVCPLLGYYSEAEVYKNFPPPKENVWAVAYIEDFPSSCHF